MYFLLTGQEELLLELLGEPVAVPLTVYDPSEVDLDAAALMRSELLSEMRQVVRHYEVAEQTSGIAGNDLRRVRQIDDLHRRGRIRAFDLSDPELRLAAHLQTTRGVAEFGLKAALGPGEASCVAIAWKRGWQIATDDGAALRVLEGLHGHRDFPYERIRKLLIRAAISGHMTRADANLIHAEMRQHGFWDLERPFP